MSELVLPTFQQNMVNRGKISGQDVLELRRKKYDDGQICRGEAEQLFALDKSVKIKCEEWFQFFNEAIVNYVLSSSGMAGDVSNECADWLIRCTSRHGVVESHERMEMLICVLEKANQVPTSLQTFALKQVEIGVLENQGPVDRGRFAARNVICRADVAMIRRLMFALGGSGGMAVTKLEAEFLFNLNDATIERQNDPAWSDLFVKAIANHLLATNGDSTPDRQAVLREDQFLSGDTMTNFLTNSLKSLLKAMKPLGDQLEQSYRDSNNLTAAELSKAEIITDQEKQWVLEKINRDSVLHENEVALVEFLAKEAPNLPQELKSMLKQAS